MKIVVNGKDQDISVQNLDQLISSTAIITQSPTVLSAVWTLRYASVTSASSFTSRPRTAYWYSSAVVAAARAGHASLDPSQLRQAADNLVRNAIEATPSGGRVRVGARREGAEHVLEVEDSGPGIVPEHLPKIFDLYFTTKAGGTGVGLAVTHQIVSAHGGTIEVDSRPGQGTRMTIRLPHVEEPRG